ncbi:myotubularin-related protein 9-like [Pomacea canaliculata]|uniref:myotubularin-related protein 9-like n=1 Tax=Pomacea canaliculata TaxID=400727 RepID=UPI000D731C3E|nr:myotubularin-related protein 9-like [Pomacea canaliculata]
MEFSEFIKTPKVDGVTLRRPFCSPLEGTLCVTGHHLLLSSRKDDNEIWLLHSRVDSVEKRLNATGNVLTLKCKDFVLLQLDIPSAEDCINVASSIEQLSNIDDITLKFPFFFRPTFEVLENGWGAFQPEMEFNRFKEISEDWRLSYVNKDFSVCSTYPHAVIVPKSIDDETLIKAAAFRMGGRFPVFSYFHKDSKAVLMRSSQPLAGTSGRRCKEDEKLVNSILGNGRRGYILDTRAQNVAKVAQSKGGGYELESNYPQWWRIHQPIERRQAFHDSLIKMIEASSDSNSNMDKWLSKLDSSAWMTHIKDILTTACVVAQTMDKQGTHVLVHGAEGMDTTLLVTSLAQLILDKDCRTVNGFEALIEREWIQAGHPFRHRCAKSAYAISKQRHESPVFLLFVDCVWQIWSQFPCSFEFNEDFLIMLVQHAYYSQFGTFLCNNEAERHQHKLKQRTVSLWSYLNRPEIIKDYLNPMYEPNPAVIWPSVAPQSLSLWNGLYLRTYIDQTPVQEAWEEMKRIREHDKEVTSKAIRLRRQLEALKREALAAGVILPSALTDGVESLQLK